MFSIDTYPLADESEIIAEIDVMVTMRDSVRLATTVYRPAGTSEPVPVIMERTPYDKSAPAHREIVLPSLQPMSRSEFARYFIKRGYAVVFQDCRGRYKSEGIFSKYLSEGEDGYDTLEWLKGQSWCDGRVAMNGLSYAAHTQTSLASLSPSGLSAMLIDSGGSSEAFHSGVRQGGAFELKQVTWAFENSLDAAIEKGDAVAVKAHGAKDLKAWFKYLPWKPGHSAVSHVPEYEEALFRQWTAGNDDAYWRKVGHFAYYDNFPAVPAILLVGWYDAWARAIIDHYEALRVRNKGPLSLIIGPWLHGQRYITHAGDVDFGTSAAFDGHVAASWLEYRADWLDHWLFGADNKIEQEPRVRLFLMGGGSGLTNKEGRLSHGGQWIGAADWPLPGSETVQFYLHGDGRLGKDMPGLDNPPLLYQHDPSNPVPTIGGAMQSGEPVFSGGCFNQMDDARFHGCSGTGIPLAARHDILVFETAPLSEDVAVIGPVDANLWVSSDCPDTDFTVKLIDVYPPSEDYPEGFALNLTDGIFRCRYRHSWEIPQPIGDGEIFKVTVRAFPTANLFKAGHRIRIDIASSNFPHFDVNSNTYEPEGQSRLRRIATNSVFVDAARASFVNLQALPVDLIVPFYPSR